MSFDKRPLVGVVMGSRSDFPIMRRAAELLKKFGIPFEISVISAHRSPKLCQEYAIGAKERGLEVIIVGAGSAAHLAGVIAANTDLPVIGVPINSSPLMGIDAIFSILQMPAGVPVGTMAVGEAGARNSAIFAAKILSLKYENIAKRLKEFRDELLHATKKGDEEVKKLCKELELV